LFEESRRTHIPVMEKGERGNTLRGLLSSARVKKLLSA
jgi:hypothetical protein